MVKAIETQYKGYRFRSRLEARWAVFFDALGVEWEFEKEGFELPSGRYLPDFYLPNVPVRRREGDCWVEVKGRRDDACANDKCAELADATGIDVIAVYGYPAGSVSVFTKEDGYFQYFAGGEGWDCCMCFVKCRKCGQLRIDFSNYLWECRHCDCTERGDQHPTILKAEVAAKSARFEFGEEG